MKIGIRTIQKKIATNEEPSLSNNNGSVINLNFLRSFCENDPQRMQKYLSMFLQSAPVLIRKINEALVNDDLAEISSQAHGFKTELIMMGMNEAKELAVSIEIQYKEGKEINEVKDSVLHLIHHVEQARSELQSLQDIKGQTS
jgi:HPt (histidine-containing phosphotransfer) domain-containing protein